MCNENIPSLSCFSLSRTSALLCLFSFARHNTFKRAALCKKKSIRVFCVGGVCVVCVCLHRYSRKSLCACVCACVSHFLHEKIRAEEEQHYQTAGNEISAGRLRLLRPSFHPLLPHLLLSSCSPFTSSTLPISALHSSLAALSLFSAAAC